MTVGKLAPPSSGLQARAEVVLDEDAAMPLGFAKELQQKTSSRFRGTAATR